MNAELALFLLSIVPPAPAPAAPVPKDPWLAGPFSFYVENDSLPLAGGDESYTQGLELQLTMGEGEPPWPIRWPVSKMKAATLAPLRALRGARRYEESSSVLLGQTIFTPQNIITYDPLDEDRPFVGHLYAGVASVLQALTSKTPAGGMRRPRRFTGRLTLGVTGDAAGAHTAQAAFHVLRESRIPKGWYTQNELRPEANALFMWEEIFGLPCFRTDVVDFTTSGQGALGTTQTYAALGGTLRIGWRLSGFPPITIPVSVAERKQRKEKERLELALLAGAEAKLMAWNRLADQGGTGRPDFKPFVYEWRLGAMARLKNGLSLSYMVRRRSQEIEPLPPDLVAKHWIGSLQIAKSFNETKMCGCRPLKGLRANFGLGRGKSRTNKGVPADPALSLAGHWGIEKSIYGDRFAVAVESTGVVREHGRGDGTSHRDTFLLAKAATLGLEVFPCLKSRHRLQVRAGVGSALVKTQTTPSEGGIEEPRPLQDESERGASVLGGLRYAVAVGSPVSVVADATYSRLFLDGDETGIRRAWYWTLTGGVQLHLWGRDRKH